MITLIVCHDRNRLIGVNNQIPWHDKVIRAEFEETVKEDMRFFKSTTVNSVVVMGRKTFESLSRPLPQRLNIILSKTPQSGETTKDCIVTDSVDLILERYSSTGMSVFVMGGAEIYKLMLPHASRIYRSVIDYAFKTDVNGENKYFPRIDKKVWRLAETKPLAHGKIESLVRI